ncbi:hypothetical protein D6C98_03388 [Aureobasidium pullulans]|uniref:F-box domain-containing protein n=1 Tax=Aureobasidium pullulans TaxID=5580 RepID=A0A4S8XBN7_AURPU|nr:hypothetical protein D6D22_07394 [Aureobasidium pullulans]THY57607.1 hypothetical protein D6C98_03388 [Aureobasidium pullulans]THZ21955.1 hypothetical protein D6C89_06357 [Aureobasidium pullulans]
MSPSSTGLIVGPLPAQHPAELLVHTMPRTNAHPVLHTGEHINKIMGYLHNDKRTLSVAVAVCKQWTWAGRHLLWDDVKPKEVARTVSSHRRQQYYATFIRILDFDWSEAVFGSLNVSHLEFSNLQTLSLHEEHLEPRGPNVMLALITPALKSLTIIADHGFIQRAPEADAQWLKKLQHVAIKLSKLTMTFNICVTTEQLNAFFKSMPPLTHLTLGDDVSETLSDEGVASIFANPHLEDLTLIRSITPSTMSRIQVACTKPLDKMRTLNLRFDDGAGRAASALFRLMPNVQNVYICLENKLGYWRHTTDSIVFATLGSLKNITTLQIDIEPNIVLRETDLIALSPLKQLQVLSLCLTDDAHFPNQVNVLARGQVLLKMLLGMTSLKDRQIMLPGVVWAKPEEVEKYEALCREKGWNTEDETQVVAYPSA